MFLSYDISVVNCSDPNSRSHHRNIEELAEWSKASTEDTNDTDSFTTNTSSGDGSWVLSSDSEENYTDADSDANADGGQCGLVAMVMEDAWHYIVVVPLQDSVVRLQLSVQLKGSKLFNHRSIYGMGC